MRQTDVVMTDVVDRPVEAHAADELDAHSTEELVVALVTDDELTALALAADPDVPIAADAVSLWDLAADGDEGGRALLPSWYMPVGGAGVSLLAGWRRRVAWALIVAFVAIDAVGLCTTYGPIFHG